MCVQLPANDSPFRICIAIEFKCFITRIILYCVIPLRRYMFVGI